MRPHLKLKQGKMNRRMHSFGAKLVGYIALLITAIAISLYIYVPHLMTKRSIELISQKAASITTMTAYSVRAALDFESIPDIENAFTIARQNDDLLYMVLKNRNGQIVYSYNLDTAISNDYNSAKSDYIVTDDDMVYKSFTEVKTNDRFIGELFVGLSLEELREDIASFRSRLLYGTFLVIIFGIFTATIISKVVTKPLERIVRTFDDISKGDLTKRADVESKDEIGQLAESFNLMVESLEFAINELEYSNKNLQLEINERRKAEEELRKLTQAIVQSPVSTMITNTDKIIEYVNPKFTQITGYTPEETIGKSNYFLVNAERDPSSYNGMWETISKGREWKGEFQSKRKDGSIYWEFVSISALTNSDNEITDFITVAEDISESKKLEEMRKRYDFIVNSSKEYMALVNRDFVFEAVNLAFCDILGLDREKILNHSLNEVMNDESMIAASKAALGGCFLGKETSVEIKYNFPKAGDRFLSINFYPYVNENKEITHVAFVAKDVTDKREAELVLKESEERYRELVSNLPDLVVVHQYGKILFINDAVKEVLGYDKERVIGSSFLKLVAEDYRDKVHETITKREQGEDVESYEIEMISIDGEKLYMEIRGALITYDNNPATLNVIVNITERKKLEMQLRKINEELESRISERTSELVKVVEQLKREVEERKIAEQSLRDSEEKFRALAEYSSDMIMRLDRDFRHLYVNKAASDTVGIPADEFIGKTQKELDFNSFVEKQWTNAAKIVFETKSAYRIEFEFEKGRWMDLIVSPEFSSDNKVKTVLTTARDITALKQNEIELIEAKEKALESSRLKSEFLANMSHEIRTPMNAILGFTDVLNSYLTDQKQKNYLMAIKAAGKNLLTLINDILDLSKIEAGRMELNYEPIDLYSFMNEIKNIFAMRVSEKNLDFYIDIDEELPKSLLIDEVRLRQILFNLIGNAVKFTETGYIKLSLNKMFRDDEKSSVDLIFGVEDSGIGIPKESHKAIFESFRQQEGQSTKKYGGTGLGLAITRRLVEMMDGVIKLTSTPGRGSKFEIILYNVRAASAPARPSIQENDDTNGIIFKPAKILIVDDVEINRKLITEYFPGSKLEFFEAGDGLEAVEKTKEVTPDVILMDIRMPVMNGYEAIRRIRTNKNYKHIPVIAITASAMKEDKTKIDDAGFNGYLMKPVQKSELYNELKNYLEFDTVSDGRAAEQTEALAEEENQEKISPEAKQELLKILDGELRSIHETAAKNHFINDAVELAERLLELAEKYPCNVLKSYGNDLKLHAENFDIEEMQHILNRYDKLIDTIRETE